MCICTYIHKFIHVYTNTHMYIYIYIYTHICIYSHSRYKQINKQANTCIYICVYIHICMYMYVLYMYVCYVCRMLYFIHHFAFNTPSSRPRKGGVYMNYTGNTSWGPTVGPDPESLDQRPSALKRIAVNLNSKPALYYPQTHFIEPKAQNTSPNIGIVFSPYIPFQGALYREPRTSPNPFHRAYSSLMDFKAL